MLTNRTVGVLLIFSSISQCGEVAGGEPLRSGPHAGERLPGMFHSLALAKKDVETQECLICRHGNKPIVLVFARDFSKSVFDLIKQLDSAAAANQDAKVGVFVVFLGESALKHRGELHRLGEQNKLTETVLTIYPAEAPRGYHIPATAAVTVLICRDLTVRTNFAFRSGELKENKMTEILKATKHVAH